MNAAILFPLLVAGVLVFDVAPARAADPICGDVNDSGAVNTTDALLVLKKGVGQDVELPCSGYGGQIETCRSDLSSTNSDLEGCSADLAATNADLAVCLEAPECGNGVLEDGESCEAGNLDSMTCASLGFAGGMLRCAAGCTFETADCYAERFDVSGETLVDRKTGLEWEKKSTEAGSGANAADPHDVDNLYSWCAGSESLCANPDNPFDGSAATDFLAKLNGASDGACYLGHCDWRLPTFEELEAIASLGCGSPPCVIHPAFLPMQPGTYLTGTTFPIDATYVSAIYFQNGNSVGAAKALDFYARAVRVGP